MCIRDRYEEYDGATLERVWQSLFKVYNQTLRKLGDNDFSVEHTRVSARQRAGMLERVVNMIRRPSLRPGTIWRRALVLCFLTCFGGFLTCFFFNVFWSIFLAPAAILQDFWEITRSLFTTYTIMPTNELETLMGGAHSRCLPGRWWELYSHDERRLNLLACFQHSVLFFKGVDFSESEPN